MSHLNKQPRKPVRPAFSAMLRAASNDGKKVTAERLAEAFGGLDESSGLRIKKGAYDPYIEQIAAALRSPYGPELEAAMGVEVCAEASGDLNGDGKSNSSDLHTGHGRIMQSMGRQQERLANHRGAFTASDAATLLSEFQQIEDLLAAMKANVNANTLHASPRLAS